MAKRFSPDYTAEDILDLYRMRVKDGDEGRIRSLANTFRALCRLEYEPVIPPTYKGITRVVKTPFIRDTWHRVTSSLIAKPPVVHITPKDDKRADYRASANIGERFDMAMIERINKERGVDMSYNLTAQLVRDGESVLKVVHRPDAWANFPEGLTVNDQDDYKRGVDLPIAWRDVDRLSVVYEGGEYGDEWVMEYGEYTKPYLRNKYGMVDRNGRLVNPRNSLEGRPYPEGLAPTSSGRSVKVEFWNAREWHVLIDNSEAPGYPKANPYAPHLPYFRAGSYDMESLLYSLLFLVPRLDELLTMKLTWSVLGAYPNPVLETVPNSSGFPALDGPLGNPGDVSGASGQKPVIWSPGKMIDLPIGRKLSFLAPPPVGKDLNDLVLIFKSLIDIAGIPSIMRGMSGAGDSGYLANQLRAAAEMSYKLAAIALQRQLEKATEFSHWLIRSVVKQTVYVLGWEEINPKTGKPTKDAGQAWLGLTPSESWAKLTPTVQANVADLGKLGPISFQYRPTLPTDEQARAMIALQLTNAGVPLYDVRHALENYMQEEDADAIIEAMALQKALASPEMEAIVMQKALEEAHMAPPKPNPAEQLVDQFGQPLQPGMIPQGPGNLGPTEAVPGAGQSLPGQPMIPGLTGPIQPMPPQGVPGNTGGREVGMYPGIPSGQGQ